MRKFGLSKKHGGITTPLILYAILGFLLFSVPPALAASGADSIYDISQVSSTFAVNEITSYPDEYQNDIDIQYDSTNYRDSGQYTNRAHRPDVSVADSFQLPDIRIEELTVDDWQYTDFDPLGDIPHGAIDIDDDGDFAGQGWPGSGTEGVPYLIENLLIDKGGAAGHCISIRNTQLYFVIRNCTLMGASTLNAHGIFLNNVENGRIEECDFYDNTYSVNINGSRDCTMYDCYFGGPARAGEIQYSTDILVEQCTFSELSRSFTIIYSDHIEVQSCNFSGIPGPASAGIGLHISSSDYCTIEDCDFINYDDEGKEGVLCNSGYNNTFSECNFTNNYMGLYLAGSYYEVFNNYFMNNSFCGILLHGTEAVVHDNIFYKDGDFGLFVNRGNNCTVANNTITETTGIGIGSHWGSGFYPTSHGTLFSNNTCVNNEYGMAFLAYSDYMTGNTFTENNCSYNTFDGMYFENCRSNILEDNICTNNGRHGIVLYDYSILNTLSNNDCSHNQVGILLEDDSHETSLEANTCDFCDVYGICLIDSSQNELSNNDCFSGSMDGIAVLGLSDANDLLNNTCTSNTGYGVYVNGTGSNTIADGAYSYNSYGIFLDWTFSNVISSCTCQYNDIGIMIVNDFEYAFNELIDNDCSHNLDQGIVLIESGDNLLDNNYCTDNGAGIYMSWAHLNDLVNNTCVVNTLYGIYIIDGWASWLSDNNCSDNPNGLWIEESNSVTAQENELTDCTTGITVIDSSGVNLLDNICTESDIGVSMTSSIDGQILNSNCSDNALYGIYLDVAHNIEIENNEINDNNVGIYLVNTNNGEVTFNTIFENFYGVFIMSGTSNEVWDNDISGNFETGVHIDTAPVDSYVHNNKLLSNFRNALDDGLTSLIIFNFWSNYTGVDADSNGLGDTPHNVTGAANNSDPYPLVFHPGAPVFDVEPTGQAVEFGDTFHYDLGASSYSPLKEWRIDDTVHFSISSEGVITNIVPLNLGAYGDPGEYPIVVTVENIYNYTTSATFTVIYQDTVIPTVVGPDDYSYVEGTTGHTLRWNASDLTLLQYDIEVEPYIHRFTEDWGDFNHTDDFFELNIDGLSAGTYNFTILVSDSAYNWNYDSVIVTVTELGGTGAAIPFDMFLLGIGAVGVAVIVVVIFVIKRRTP